MRGMSQYSIRIVPILDPSTINTMKSTHIKALDFDLDVIDMRSIWMTNVSVAYKLTKLI